jgi:serine/threonine protein kinase
MIEATTGQTELTRTATVVGTAAYLSPEQARGDPVSSHTDLYALGCLLFALVTGGPPFRGESALVVCSQHLHREPPHLSDLLAGVPPAFSTLVDDLLQKDASHRPADAEVVRSRLAAIDVVANAADVRTIPLAIADDLASTCQYSANTSWTAPLPSVQQPPRPSFNPVHHFTTAISRSWARISHRKRWAAGFAAAVILGITLPLLILNSHSPAASPTAPALTIPATSPGSSPLPASLVRSLNDLARSVE